MKTSSEVLEQELTLSPQCRFLKKHGLYSAALYYKDFNETVERRTARAARYNLEHQTFPTYRDGQQIFMCNADASMGQKAPDDDPNDYGLWVPSSGDISADFGKFNRLRAKCENDVEAKFCDNIGYDCGAMHCCPSNGRNLHFGLHFVPDMPAVLHDGINGYRKKALEILASNPEPQMRMFQEGILDIVEGLENYIARYAAHLEAQAKTFAGDRNKLERLIAAVHRVPMEPASSFYEAVVSATAVMYLSSSVEPGRIDDYLFPYYEQDLAAGKTSPEDALSLIREIFEDIDNWIGHPGTTHVTLGGTRPDGSPVYNALTKIAIVAIQGLRTPNVTLRVREDMPQFIWDVVLYNHGKGYCQPALINDQMVIDNLVKDYQIPYEDAVDFALGGCSELMIQGRTCCDSTWVAFNALDVFEQTMYNHFLDCNSYEDFYEQLKEDCVVSIQDMGRQNNMRQANMGLHIPSMMQALFCRGCIDNGKSFYGGGAQYNLDNTNVFGLTNTVNSLYTIKQYFEGKLGDFSKEDFLACLASNYKGYETLYRKFQNVPKFGNYNPELQAIAADLGRVLFQNIMDLHCFRGNDAYPGRYMPSIIQWVDWVDWGLRVGATPDGRVSSEAMADSCGPMQGTDSEGPTSVMGAALSLPQDKCIGTCILNLRLDSANFRSPETVWKIQKLYESYFKQGGSQLQISVVDPEQLIAAMKDPEKHKDIIVRVGGFSDNFVYLDESIQKEIIKRTLHTA